MDAHQKAKADLIVSLPTEAFRGAVMAAARADTQLFPILCQQERVKDLARHDHGGELFTQALRGLPNFIEPTLKSLLALPFGRKALDKGLACALAASYESGGEVEHVASWALLLQAGADPNAKLGKEACERLGGNERATIAQALAHTASGHHDQGGRHILALQACGKFEACLFPALAKSRFAHHWIENRGNQQALVEALDRTIPRWIVEDPLELLPLVMERALCGDSYLFKQWDAAARKAPEGCLEQDRAVAGIRNAFLIQAELFRIGQAPASWHTLWTGPFASIAPLFKDPAFWEAACGQAVRALEPMFSNPPSKKAAGASADALFLSMNTPQVDMRAKALRL